MADFKNLAWATSFASQASGKFICLPYMASGEKTLLSYPAVMWDFSALASSCPELGVLWAQCQWEAGTTQSSFIHFMDIFDSVALI